MSSQSEDESAMDLQKKDCGSSKNPANEVMTRQAEETLSNCSEPKNHKRRRAEDEEGLKTNKKIRKETDEECSNVPSDLSTGINRGDSRITETEKTVNNTTLVANHYNTLEEKGLSKRAQSCIVYMRNFNNWIKSMLINEFLQKVKQSGRGASLKVLDMCCGKGGDLLKWKTGNIRHLVCADIAEVSIEQCQIRYKEFVSKDQNRWGFEPIFTAEFLVADCTKDRLREKYKDASIQFDLVSCQFAVHYSFETLPQAENILQNASETLRPGGYFIGTVPDAYSLVSRWQKCEGNKFGNDVYSVEFMCENKEKPPLFGAKYNYHLEGVVDCPEFLVHMPTFCKLASKFGLKLVLFERFADYYKKMKDEGRSLLAKMQGLETYPPCHDAPLVGKSQDYQHAVQYMQNSTGHRKIGTLSQPEWEATSLYAVFAFQKMKTKWNDKGKPEYEDL